MYNSSHFFEKVSRVAEQPLAFNRDELSEDDLISGLRCYIRKNKLIPGFYEKVEQHTQQHQHNIEMLESAVNEADFNARIFDHPNCSKYLLYLVEHKQIAFWLGMSVYTYLMVLAQFTDRQLINDNEIKLIRNVEIKSLVDGKTLSSFGSQNLEKLAKEFSKLNISFDIMRATECILSLQPFEQQMIVVEIKQHYDDSYSYSVDDFVESTLAANIPFLKSEQRHEFNIPSYGVINIILALLSENPMQMKPVFGRIGNHTRDMLHAKDQHPVALYSSDVKSNVKNVHGTIPGPIPVWLHDIGHIFGASLLTYRGREFIQDKLLPHLIKIKGKIIQRGNGGSDALLVSLNNLTFNLNDYNLTPITNYHHVREKLDRNVSAILYDQRGIYSSAAYTQIVDILLPELDSLIQGLSNNSEWECFAGLVTKIRKAYEAQIPADLFQQVQGKLDLLPKVI